MCRYRALSSALVLLGLIAAPHLSTAAWPHDPGNGNLAVCADPGNQYYPTACADGAGGAIVVWEDNRGTSTDVYAQRVSAAGTPLWTANGVLLCSAAGNQLLPKIASDGAGGAIVAWQDSWSGTYDIFAQRISAAGATQWTTNGVGVCALTADQTNPTLATDGASGAIFTWQDARAATPTSTRSG